MWERITETGMSLHVETQVVVWAHGNTQLPHGASPPHPATFPNPRSYVQGVLTSGIHNLGTSCSFPGGIRDEEGLGEYR